MKKFYRIFLLLVGFIFLTTYNPSKFNSVYKRDNKFFKIQNIIIVNHYLLKKKLLNERLNQIYNKNIFSIKKRDIEDILNDIDFLKKVEVKKKYPNTLVVKIFETRPIAILFKDKSKYLLDDSSNLISFVDGMNFDKLPTIFGDNAEKNFANFFKQLENNNFPINEIKNFYYFQIGRWDLQLLNNKIIKLPNNNMENAIKESVKLLDRDDFKNYNIIDLRVDGKIIVE